VFLEKEAKQFPSHQPWDIAIDFEENAPKTLDCKIYPLMLTEQGKLDEYIKENLKKDIFDHQNLDTCHLSSLLGKRTGNYAQ
jgi:hypothetical protein